jgi:hypothetical protein
VNKQLSLLIVAATLSVAALSAQAYDGEWKRGRVYFQQVCTGCHKSMVGKAISPNEKTKAEWAAYLAADKHGTSGKSNPSVKYFVSRAYRDSIKDSNKAAAKFLDVPEAELAADIKAFATYGAKDSDNPSRCQ